MRFLVAAAILLGLSLGAASAQTDAPATALKLVPRFAVMPGYHAPETLREQAAAGATVPLWSGQITVARKTYDFSMVGNSPLVAEGNPVTTVPAILYPVKFIFQNSRRQTLATQDPTAADPTCSPAGTPLSLVENSPFFNAVDLTIDSVDLGSGQFTSLFQRANFWTYTGAGANPDYQVTLSLTVGDTIAVTEKGAGTGVIAASCGQLGYLNINAWDKYVRGTLLKQLNISPTTVPIFLFYNTVMIEGRNLAGCCILGYHGATSGKNMQTYLVVDFDTSGSFGDSAVDTSILSHELAEWLDDPDGSNPTPRWGHTGQVSGCQKNLEVADPLTGVGLQTIPLNGFDYHVQDLAFFSWFYGQVPSVGLAPDYYSLFGTFRSPAAACK